MSQTLACFLTWTTYGTWLSGDNRGWVARGDTSAQPYRDPNRQMADAMRRRMKGEPIFFGEAEREIVDASLIGSCRINQWRLHARAVRTNHVHIVLTASELTPEEVLKKLKTSASKALNLAGIRKSGRHWWTDHGSTRYIKTEHSLAQAIQYVEDQ